jgi:hypothetical protein
MWRRAPLAVFVVATSASAVLMARGYPAGPPVGPTIALYLLARARHRDPAGAAELVAVADGPRGRATPRRRPSTRGGRSVGGDAMSAMTAPRPPASQLSAGDRRLAALMAFVRSPAWGRLTALAATVFAILGFIVGLTFTVHGGAPIDLIYHATMSPVLIVTALMLGRGAGAAALGGGPGD